MSRQFILLCLGLLFVINLFFRVRLMKIIKEIKREEIYFDTGEILSTRRFQALITNRYPQYADLLKRYRQSMLFGLVLIVIVVITMAAYLFWSS